MNKKVLNYLFPFLIIFITLFISYKNYRPNTFLSGWDTLHPEFDFETNLKRVIFGVWRKEQGLGAIAGHSHMADIPRIIFLWFLYLFFPLNLLRYLYVLFCFIFGPLGIYYLVKYLLSKKVSHKNNHQLTIKLTAFLGSLFYIFNLGTVQQFYVPFEMFTTQYAFLPWIILLTIKLLKKITKKDLISFILITFFSTPQAYAAHLWYAFFIFYLIFFLFYFVLFSDKKDTIKRIILILTITLAINSFWLLPNIYFIKSSSQIPRLSKQNRLFSQEFQLRNREHGYFKDVALIKGFYFSWLIYDFEKEKFISLMDNWQNHFNNPLVKIFGYAFFTTSITGLFISFFKRERLLISLSPIFLIPFVILLNHTYPFDKIFDLIISFNLFKEALRFVFTKFSILLIVAYTIYFTVFLSEVFFWLKRGLLKIITSFLIITSLVFYCLPIFNGNLISDKMKIKIPKEYFEFWDFMKKQKNGIILSLPLHNFTGWNYYSWGYQGAGFIWFGLKQPILDRDFNRWSLSNEIAYNEFYHHLYSQNLSFLIKALKKYNISYIFWDESITASTYKNKPQKVYQREIKNLLNELEDKKNITKIYQRKFLHLYKVINEPEETSIKIKKINISIFPPYLWDHSDPAFNQFGEYITYLNKKDNNQIKYPFRELINLNQTLNSDFVEFNPEDKFLYFKIKNSTDRIIIPPLMENENYVYGNFYIKKISENLYRLSFIPLLEKLYQFSAYYDIKIKEKTATFTLNNENYYFNVSYLENDLPFFIGEGWINLKNNNLLNGKKINFVFEEKNNKTFSFYLKLAKNPIFFSAEKIFELNRSRPEIKLKNNNLLFSSVNKQTGIYVSLDNLPHELGYILAIENKSITGLPFRICVFNYYTKLCSLYDEVEKHKEFKYDYFIIPPADNSFGYGISVNNISFGNYLTENVLKKIYLLPLPLDFLRNIYFIKNDQLTIKKISSDFIYHKNIQNDYLNFYTAPLNLNHVEKNTFLIFYQSFHPGWKAYQIGCQNSSLKYKILTFFPFFFGKELKDHVLVNNWANGWKISGNQLNQSNSVKSVVIIFWPQYLEFLGFGLLVISFLIILMIKDNNKLSVSSPNQESQKRSLSSTSDL